MIARGTWQIVNYLQFADDIKIVCNNISDDQTSGQFSFKIDDVWR